MVKLTFTNAVVEDGGYGLEVNGRLLADYISVALGTKVGKQRAFDPNSKLSEFKSTSCDITIIIDPQPVTTTVETDEEDFGSIEELEEAMREQLEKKTKQADAEE